MYWVSPVVAKQRGRGVKPGWYVVAKVGEYFDLHIANVKENVDNSPSVAVATHIDVDGVNPLGAPRALLCKPGMEAVVRGFAESAQYSEGKQDGTLNMRRFRFAKAEVGEVDEGEKGVSRIILRVSCGAIQNAPLAAVHEKDLLSKTKTVSEKKAIKVGESVRVEREGQRIKEKLERAQFQVTKSEILGAVIIYIRERNWLQARNIIDRRGGVWKPRISTNPIDLTEMPDEVVEPDRKKPKIGLTFIDLT